MVNPEILAKEFLRMDAFLICYDVEKDQSKGTNYHKVMEYLAYGRPIVSNYISRYASDRDNFIMPEKAEMRLQLYYIKELLGKLENWSNVQIEAKTYTRLTKTIIF